MKIGLKSQLLKSISKVYKKAAKSKLKQSIFKDLEEELQFLSSYFKLNQIQSFFLANIITINYKGNEVIVEDLNDHFNCSPIDIMEWSDDINFLIENAYLKTRVRIINGGGDFFNIEMSVNNEITKAILNSEVLPALVKNTYESPIELVEEIYKLTENRYHEDLGVHYLRRKIASLFERNENNPWVKYCNKYELYYEDIATLNYLVWKALTATRDLDLSYLLERIHGCNSRMIAILQEIINKDHNLVKKEFIEVKEDAFLNGSDVSLSKKILKDLSEMGIKIIDNEKSKNKNLLLNKDLVEKTLFHNEIESKQLDRLKKMLDDKTLQATRKRLEAKKLPKGITAVFYGPPGTGKTESVKQLAKATGRNIFKVEISETKSMWFGQSEKLIKQIFTDYKKLCEESNLIPILLFNEADAILSSRSKNLGSSIDQTMNAIQNILLEELENFEGILMATTNLTGNLDSAFDRRFLFKIEINKPSTDIKAKIWQSKIETLSEKEALVLAKQFDFSGGQIDNIVRKKEIEEIINGKNIDFEEIVSYCSQENFNSKQVFKVGFNIDK